MIGTRAGKVVAGLTIVLLADRVVARMVPSVAPAASPPDCGPVDPAAAADIAVMGDSQSEDADRGRGPSWVAHLRRLRGNASIRDSVVSHACGGLRAAEAAMRWPHGDPRVVIFWAGWNDLVASPPGASSPSASSLTRALTASGFVRLAAAASRGARRARREASLDTLAAGPPAAPDGVAGRIAAYDAAVREVHQRFAETGSALVLVSPPWAGMTLDRADYRSLAYQTGQSVATLARMHAALLASYRRLCAELPGVRCYDAAADVDALPPLVRRRLFADPLHWSAGGSEWIATRIDSVLRVMSPR